MSNTITKEARRDVGRLHLEANGNAIDPRRLKGLSEISASAPVEEIRRQFELDGYVLVKGLLPREDVLSVRRKYFEFFSPTGMCKEGEELQGTFSGKNHDEFIGVGAGSFPALQRPKDMSLYLQLVEKSHFLPEYLALCHHPALDEFVKRFTGWSSPVLLRRTLLRANIPRAETTGIHYDRIFLRDGDPSFLTAWMPIGEIDPRGGGLMYLEDSKPIAQSMEERWQSEASDLPDNQRVSPYNVTMKEGAICGKDVQEFAQRNERNWLFGNYEAGDVVFHDSFMIHASCTNFDPHDAIRLATDLRYCNPDKKVDQRWMEDYRVGNTPR